ncbi:MAG: SWIM zinc finger family protein [Acidimicrobiales bacterium]
MTATVVHTYGYLRESSVMARPGRVDVALATSGGGVADPVLFRGRVEPPALVARLLLCIARVSRNRFYTPAAMIAHQLRLADPVITSHGDRLRFESFSSCCGVYARLDLLPDSLTVEAAGRGTTNVDVNSRMRAALSEVDDTHAMRLDIGSAALTLEAGGKPAVERKVELPSRWVKGFSEVQVIQSSLVLCAELSAAKFLRFRHGLPAASRSAGPLWAVPAGDGMRLGSRPQGGAVSLGGPHRLRALGDVATGARRVRVYGGDGASAWEFDHGAARLVLVLSPDASRGFSGEGAALRDRVSNDAAVVGHLLRTTLAWQPSLNDEALADTLGLKADAVRAGLRALGAAGELGFDLAEQAFFHRPLPYEGGPAAIVPPRLRDARRLVEARAVFMLRYPDESGVTEAMVNSGGVEHRVWLSPTEVRCSCPWFALHRGARGPCKHELAVRLRVDG